MAKFRFYLDTGFVGAEYEEEVELDVDGLSEEEKLKEVDEALEAWVRSRIEYGWEMIEG